MPIDKLGHFIAGVNIAATVDILMMFTGLDFDMHLYVSVLAAITVGIGKEIYDYLHPETHCVEALDAIATIAGGLVVSLPLWWLRCWL